MAFRDESREKNYRKEPFLLLLPVLLFLPFGVSLLFPGHAVSRNAIILLPVPLFAASEADYSTDPSGYWIPPINKRIIREVIQDQGPYAGDLEGRLGTLAAILQTPVATMTRLPGTNPTSHPIITIEPPATAAVAIPVTGPTKAPTTGLIPTQIKTSLAFTPVSSPTVMKTWTASTQVPTLTYRPTSTPAPPIADPPTRTLAPTPTGTATKTYTSTASSPGGLGQTPTPSATFTHAPSSTATFTSTNAPTRPATSTPTLPATQTPSPTHPPTAAVTPNAKLIPTHTETFPPTPSLTPSPDLECVPPDLINGFVLGVDPPDGATNVPFNHNYIMIYFRGEMKTEPGSGMVENVEYYQVMNVSNHRNLPILNRQYDPVLNLLRITFDTDSPFWNALWKHKAEYQVIVKGAVQNNCSMPQTEDVTSSFRLESRQASK